jgi:hypothetical protein
VFICLRIVSEALPVPTYRCFFLGAEDHLLDIDVAVHADDGAAARWAAGLLTRGSPEYRATEVWDRHRLVCRHVRAPAPTPEPRATVPAPARSAP